jgi:bacterioferritin-associated ferredoxin
MQTGTKSRSKVVCECLGVTEAQLTALLRSGRASTPAELGECTDAGNGCTACHPALRALCERQDRASRERQSAAG